MWGARPGVAVRAIVHERRCVTADTALRLARYFGVEVEFWPNLQQGYDFSKAVVEHGAEIEREVEVRQWMEVGVGADGGG